jgi:hypothetical protein
MNEQESVFEVSTLKRVEGVYRAHLQKEPDDMTARASLAWCLFMQSLHQAGQERALEGLRQDQNEESDEELGSRIQTLLTEHNARFLLRDCLRQTVAVMQLSPDPQAHQEIEKLRSLVKLSGACHALCESEDDAASILTQLTEEMRQAGLDHRRRERLPRESGA